jgi:hypothetical protein
LSARWFESFSDRLEISYGALRCHLFANGTSKAETSTAVPFAAHCDRRNTPGTFHAMSTAIFVLCRSFKTASH